MLNKIDRLFLELKLSSVEAFYHLRRLVENANALASTLLNSELRRREGNAKEVALDEDEDDPLVLDWTFSPEKVRIDGIRNGRAKQSIVAGQVAYSRTRS